MDKRSAIVLAGGRSSRMGADKAALPWGDTTMLERVVARLARGFGEIVVVAAAEQRLELMAASGTVVRVVRDCETYAGPVMALRLGLASAAADIAFACACDLPFLNVELAAALCAKAAGRDCAIPVVAGQRQVLHAAFAQSCLPALDKLIARGARKLQDLVPMLRARFVDETELYRYDSRLLSFLNVNTPEDYARARRLDLKDG